MNNNRMIIFLPLIAFIFITIVYSSTFYGDHNWGGDFAQYIHQAIKLCEGESMTDTGYIYSRYTPSIGPPTYPAGFPILLVPIISIFGLNMTALQVEMTIIQLVALVVIYLIFSRKVSIPTATVLLLMLGLSPYFIAFKQQIRSDVPYLLFSSIFLLWAEYSSVHKRFGIHQIFIGASLITFCYLIRTVGLTTLGILLAADLVRYRKLHSFTLWVTGISLFFIAFSHFLFDTGESAYIHQLANYSPAIIISNSEHYLLRGLQAFWAGPSLPLGQYRFPVLCFLVLPLFLCGIIYHVRTSSLLYEFFFIFHLAIILAWPTPQEIRFLYPILPLLLLYAGLGFELIIKKISKKLNHQIMHPMLVILALGIILVYSVRTTKVIAAQSPIHDGPYSSSSIEMFDFVRNKTQIDSVFIFYKPRVLALYTKKKASAFPYSESLSTAVSYLIEIDTDYVILKKQNIHMAEKKPNAGIKNLITSYPHAFEQVFSNSMFIIYTFNHSI